MLWFKKTICFCSDACCSVAVLLCSLWQAPPVFLLKASRHFEGAMDPRDSPLTSSMTLRAFQGMRVYKKQTLKATWIHDHFLMCCSGPIPASTGLTFHPIPHLKSSMRNSELLLKKAIHLGLSELRVSTFIVSSCCVHYNIYIYIVMIHYVQTGVSKILILLYCFFNHEYCTHTVSSD